MSKEKYIVGIGAANCDIYGKSSIKIKEHYDHPSIIKTTVGGVTRNILENCSRLGLNTKLLTVVGDDIYGEMVIKESDKAGIDTSNVEVIKGERTGVFMQVQTKDNDMHLALCDMSISKNIDIDFIKSKDKIISNAAAIVLDPSLDTKTIEYILTKYLEIPVFVDPISDLYAKKIRPYINMIYCIKPNKTELSVLANIKINNKKDLYKAYDKVNKKVTKVYVSLGKDGCLYENDEKIIVSKKLKPVKKMVNASGAGDAFMAALIYGYINELENEETIDLALASGIAATLDENAINKNLSVKLLRRIYKENKYEL